METIRLYHGTSRRFSQFATRGVSPRFYTGAHILGHYFTESADHVLAYARGRWGKVYVVDASFEAMKIVPPRPSGMSEIDGMQLDFNEQDFTDFRNALIAEGYDSICFETVDGFCEYVFMYDEQLKIVDCIPAQDFAEPNQQSLVF